MYCVQFRANGRSSPICWSNIGVRVKEPLAKVDVTESWCRHLDSRLGSIQCQLFRWTQWVQLASQMFPSNVVNVLLLFLSFGTISMSILWRKSDEQTNPSLENFSMSVIFSLSISIVLQCRWTTACPQTFFLTDLLSRLSVSKVLNCIFLKKVWASFRSSDVFLGLAQYKKLPLFGCFCAVSCLLCKWPVLDLLFLCRQPLTASSVSDLVSRNFADLFCSPHLHYIGCLQCDHKIKLWNEFILWIWIRKDGFHLYLPHCCQKMLSEGKWNAGKLFAMIFDNGWLFKSLNWRPIVRCTCTLCFSFRGIPTPDWSWLWIVWECVELDLGEKKGGVEEGHSFGKIDFSDF